LNGTSLVQYGDSITSAILKIWSAHESPRSEQVLAFHLRIQCQPIRFSDRSDISFGQAECERLLNIIVHHISEIGKCTKKHLLPRRGTDALANSLDRLRVKCRKLNLSYARCRARIDSHCPENITFMARSTWDVFSNSASHF
jgi:hypothetical protein